MRRWMVLPLLLIMVGLLKTDAPHQLSAQQQGSEPNIQFNRYYYYPYYYFPHNYWPATGPKWPEAQGAPYQRPPAYMAYPPFREDNWRHELWQPQKYYRGQHFFLDQF